MSSLLRRNALSHALLLCICLSSITAFGQSDPLTPLRRAIAGSRPLHQASRTQRLNLSIGLPLRNQDELDALLPQLSDPASEQFHHYLTPEQFAARFAPTAEDYQALIQFAQQNGLTVTHTHANRAVLSVSGAAEDVEKVFQVKLMTYNHPTRGEFYAPDREPTLPAGSKALDVMGLDNFAPPKPMSVTRGALAATNPLVSGSGPGGYLIGKDFRAAYAPGVTLTGTGQTVGLLEFDGFFAGDVTKNFAAAGLPAVPVQTVLVDGVSGAAGGDNIEVILDIMMASYMAPGLSKVIVYEGATPNDVLNRMATDNLAQQLSSSWGFGGVNATTEQIFKQYTAQGQSFLQASGDSGAYSNGVMPPSDDPNITVVGGTSLATSGGDGPWLSETTWSGSGGGVSTTYALPSYQSGVAMASKGGSTKMRNIPDVALTADIEMYLICDNGAQISVGGTSAAAPLWAGFLALANQQAASNAKPRVGFVNPLIYAIGSSGNYASDFHDIASGSNGFHAVGGYDLATGWGSPAGQHLINDLTGMIGAPTFTVASSIAALTINESPTSGSTASAGTAIITVAPQNSFKGTVGLAVTGLPGGVTASFSPASAPITSTASASSTLTVAVSATAAAGTYPLTITGLSGSTSSTAPLSLTITAPSFKLTAPATVTVPRSGVESTIVTVGAANGFAGAVTFSVASLPAGVTAAISPESTSGTSVISFTASATAVAGTYNVVINGVSGKLTGTTSIALTVTAPAFTLTPASSALTIARASTGSTALAISDQGGFTGTVTLSAATLPSGLTAVFSSSATAAHALTFSASSTAVAGTYPITINGVSGTLKASTTVTITITAPSFTLSPSSAAVVIPIASAETTIISIGTQNGFSGTVSLAAANLPAGLTAVFSALSSTGKSNLVLSAGSTAKPGTYTVAVNGVSGALTASTQIVVTIPVPSFTLAFTPATLGVSLGSSAAGTLKIGAVNGFNSSVSLAAAGLPSGVTALFSTTSSGASIVNFLAGTAAVAGSSIVTITGVSGSLTVTTKMTLVTVKPSVTTSFVNLAPYYNVDALAIDNAPFTGGGIDGGLNGLSEAYSSNLLGVSQMIGGVNFLLGPAGVLDATSSLTIALPAGQFGSLKLLATGVNGAQPSQSFKVTYTDGTSTTVLQSLSDWFTPASYTGETKALTMAYRDTGSGLIDNRTFYLYEYSLALNSAKTVASVTLPNNRNVVVLAATLTGATTATSTAK